MRRDDSIGSYSLGRSLVAFAAIGALLFALVLAAAPALHDHFHAEAGEAQHECAVAKVESGNELTEAAPLAAAAQSAAPFSTVPTLTPVWVPSPFLHASVFEHAPPSLS